MQSLFEKNLIRMKQELRDIKTVHQRGLGTIRFFTAQITAAIPARTGAAFRAIIDDDEPEWPIFSVVAGGSQGARGVVSVEDTTNQQPRVIEFSIMTNRADTVTIMVTSSSAIKEVIRI